MNSFKSFLYFICIVLLASCATYKAQFSNDKKTVSSTNSSEIEHSFFLIGDAGNSTMEENSPALKYLEKHIKRTSKNSTLLFLGDNVYETGIPKKKSKKYALAKRRIEAQTDVAKKFAGKSIFIPGNHDWYNGLEGLKREEKLVEKALGKKSFLPQNGCPLEKVNISKNVVLIIVDTHWYLTNWDNHPTINDNCEIKTRVKFFDELEGLIKKSRGKTTLIALHHPMFTNGSHGGKYSAKSHLSPLPVLGSVKNLIRKTSGLTNTDIQNKKYNELKKHIVTLSQENLSYNIEKITYDNGESIGHTRKIVFDSTGIMWITGRGVGLHSFDGKKIITYHLSNENYYFPLEQSVLIDKKNDETFELSDWHEQIYSFNPYSKKITDSVTFNNPKGIESGMYDFLVDSKSNKWAVTWGFQNNGDSVFVIRGEKGEKLRRIDKIRIETFPKLIEHKNRIYYTSKGSIRAYNQDGTFFKSYDLVDENLIVSPFGLCSDSKGGLWVKSNGKIGDLKKSASIFKLNESKQQFEIFKVLNDKILRDVHYINVIEDKIWLGGVREKLLTIDITTGDIEDYSEVLRGLSSKSLYINKLYIIMFGKLKMKTYFVMMILKLCKGKKYCHWFPLSA